MKFLDTIADPQTSLEFNNVKGSSDRRRSLWKGKTLLSITDGQQMSTGSRGIYDAVAFFAGSKNSLLNEFRGAGR